MIQRILQIKPSPLRMDGYFIKKLSFCLSDDVDSDSIGALIFASGLHPQLEQPFEATSPHFDLDFVLSRDDEDDKTYKFLLSIKSVKTKGHKQPYDYEVEMVAFFTWIGDDKILGEFANAVERSAIMLMYATVREVLASATARSPLPALVLPTTMFNFIIKDGEKTKKIKASPIPKPRKRVVKKTTKK